MEFMRKAVKMLYTIALTPDTLDNSRTLAEKILSYRYFGLTSKEFEEWIEEHLIEN